MEKVIKSQQEMLEVLNIKIESKALAAQSSVSAEEENEIEQVIDNHMMNEETWKEMVKAGLAPRIGAY